MKNQDNLSKYFKELPGEEASGDFTMRVMDRVRAETKKAPVEYSPLIRARGWWTIFIVMSLTLCGVILINSFFPGKESPEGLQILKTVDFSFVSKPFILLSNALSNLSVTHLFVLTGISVLLLFDKMYSRFAH